MSSSPKTATKTVAKTIATAASVKDFIASQSDEARRADCLALVKLMETATSEKARLWGSAIVGFGAYQIQYAGGRTGDWPVVAFSPRKGDLTLYIMPGLDRYAELLAQLGTHKTGKSCLYIKRLADVDGAVLQALIEASVQAMAPQRITPGKTA